MLKIFVVIIAFLALAFHAAAQTCGPLESCLSWKDNSNNETGFKIERQLNGGAFTVIMATVGANVPNFTDKTLQQSTTVDNVYCYRVAAFNASGQSVYSNEACKTVPKLVGTPVAPAAPSSLEIAVLSDSQIKLSWRDNAANETGHEITRVSFSPPRSEQILVAANALEFIDFALRKNARFCYRVRAYNDDGVSDYSNESCARTDKR